MTFFKFLFQFQQTQMQNENSLNALNQNIKIYSKLSETATNTDLQRPNVIQSGSPLQETFLSGAYVRHHIQINWKIQKVTVSLRDIERA